MGKDSLVRKLNSVGKDAFVSHYSIFKDYARGKVSKERAIEELISEGRSNYDGAAIRLSNASLIFREGANCDALIIIQRSQRLAFQTVSLAKAIYESECVAK